MILAFDLISKYQKRPAAILGGGPSLPADMERLPPGTVLFSVNQHALQLCQPDFLVFMDKPGDIPELAAALGSFRGLKVSQNPAFSDVDLTGADYWDGGFSSTLATWLACFLGCDPVLLCGMDCYQGERKYFYPHTLDHPCVNYPLEAHVRAWRPALEKCPHAERIRAMSGPLDEVFGRFDYFSLEYRDDGKS
jgi:hypothetical protein